MVRLPDTPPQARMGLGRQTAIAGCLFVALLAAATVLAHVLQWQSAVLLRRLADHDLPRTAAAYRVLEYAGWCDRFQERLETAANPKVTCRDTMQTWDTQFADLERQADVLAAKSSSKEERAEAAEWKSTLARYRVGFLAAVKRIEAGGLTTPSAVGEAMQPSRAILKEITDRAEKLVFASEEQSRPGQEELHRMAESRTRLINVRGVVAVLVVLAAVVWFHRVVLLPLKEISALLSRVAAGDLSARVGDDLPAELASLATQCNELSSAAQAREHELQRAKTTADSANCAKNETMVNIGQEMQASLSAINVQADMLLAAPHDSQCLEAAETIKYNSEYLLEIVHGISNLAKIEMGTLAIERAACSPAQVLDDVAAVLKSRAESKGLRLVVNRDGEIPDTVETDPAGLRQILFIFLGAAIKHNEAGEIRLTARHLAHASEGARLQFEVAHAGVGMTSRQIEQFSTPFSSPSFADQRLSAGNLGLTLCRRLADMLDGAIRVDSVSGGETTMALTIPAPVIEPPSLPERPVSPPVQPRPARVLPKSPGKPRFRILLAEDGPENRRLMKLILGKAGADVSVAENGQEAIDKTLGAADYEGDAPPPFDLILMDMQMPLVDGYEATRHLRQSGYGGLIVAVTGHTRSYDRQKCLDAGCNDYLAKPVDREKLLALVAEHVACHSRHVSLGT